jgi:hypothetical protein
MFPGVLHSPVLFELVEIVEIVEIVETFEIAVED